MISSYTWHCPCSEIVALWLGITEVDTLQMLTDIHILIWMVFSIKLV